ncbi:type III secretion system chaperone [Pseudomonas vanderleydeniana]|uniref:HrpG protein n=1 Tax=Pseudomonas vanderleydeniana TaxID=2745495 RepID=A0A9E6PR94_9PSED|nr:type III secretion system chaperone [Pseudomonas vanderleydeniana]QXI31251.1 HrpG protein [Pseudomonas vanderleydeniana]
MKSAELAVTVQRWLDSGEGELRLLIDQAPQRLQRRAAGVLCVALLSVAWRGDDRGLEAALRLSGPSLGRFSAALALDPVERRLCLMRYLPVDEVAVIIAAIESLANQRDAWEATLERSAAARPVNRSLPLGRHYV